MRMTTQPGEKKRSVRMGRSAAACTRRVVVGGSGVEQRLRLDPSGGGWRCCQSTVMMSMTIFWLQGLGQSRLAAGPSRQVSYRLHCPG